VGNISELFSRNVKYVLQKVHEYQMCHKLRNLLECNHLNLPQSKLSAPRIEKWVNTFAGWGFTKLLRQICKIFGNFGP